MDQEIKEWPNHVNYDTLTEAEAKFIFDQAEKQLRETSDAGNLVVSRTTNLLTLVSGILIALIGYLITKWQTIFQINPLTITSLLGICCLLIALYKLTNNLIGKDYAVSGSEPKHLFVDLFFNSGLPEKKG